LHDAQVVEGVGLAAPVTEGIVDCQRLGQAGGGGRVVPGRSLQAAQLAERAGLAWLVVGLAGRGKGALEEGGGLVPVTVGGQEAAHGGG
jgi:hypothetical protein